MQEIIGDIQTSVTSLVGAVGGVSSTYIGGQLISALEGSPTIKGNNTSLIQNTVGSVGLQFVGRAAISSTIYYLLRRYMPDTSGNVLFTFLYFTGDSGLIATGVSFAQGVVGAVVGAANKPKSGGAPSNFSASSSGCSCK